MDAIRPWLYVGKYREMLNVNLLAGKNRFYADLWGAPSGGVRGLEQSVRGLGQSDRVHIWEESTISAHTRGWHTPSERFYPTIALYRFNS